MWAWVDVGGCGWVWAGERRRGWARVERAARAERAERAEREARGEDRVRARRGQALGSAGAGSWAGEGRARGGMRVWGPGGDGAYHFLMNVHCATCQIRRVGRARGLRAS